MQTFAPYPDIAASARCLDDRRLGKQRVETLQVLRALVLPDYGWQRHPAVRMWAGAVPGLVHYGLACVAAWRERGFADSTAALIGEFAPDVVGLGQDEVARRGWLPDWWGDAAVHASHRCQLVRKDPARYTPLFADADPERDYVWPPGRDVVEEPASGEPLWVVRAPTPDAALAMRDGGFVGLDASSGVDRSVAGLTSDDIIALLRERAPKRRPGKALRQLTALAGVVQDGDRAALLLDGDRTLLLGTVRGAYRFTGGVEVAPTDVVHRRSVDWADVTTRDRLPRPALLQDPRALFAV